MSSLHYFYFRSNQLSTPNPISLLSYVIIFIYRCGAGTNNIPVPRMTELGIPVFNTPGANANAVKELVVCGMFLGSRRVVDGINHMKDLGAKGLARERVEKDKSMFGGREVMGKTLAVIGLGEFSWECINRVYTIVLYIQYSYHILSTSRGTVSS